MAKHLPLIIIFLVSLFIRIYKVEDGIIFGFDQARDAYRVQSFTREKNLMLLGPETDIPGVHHGVGYYYILSIPYAISNSPVVATVFFVVLHSIGAVFLYQFAYHFFGSQKLAFIAALLFSFSFEMVQYSRWLSNPAMAIFTTTGAAWGLYRWIEGDTKGIVIASFFVALSLHFQLFLLYFFLFPVVIYFAFRPKLTYTAFILSVCTTIILILPFIIGELRFDRQALQSLTMFFSKTHSYQDPLRFVQMILERLTSTTYYTLFPMVRSLTVFLLAGIILVLLVQTLLYLSKASGKIPRFLLIWLCINFVVFFFSSGAVGVQFSTVGAVVPLIFSFVYCFNALFTAFRLQRIIYIVIFVLAVLHLRLTFLHAAEGSYLFSVQKSITYGYEKQIIDYVYSQAQGGNFAICTLTNPSYINTTWAYLFSRYGKNKYGYVPFWAGVHQRTNIGSDDLPVDTVKPQLRFLILEPTIGMPDYLPVVFRETENYISDLVEAKKFGEFLVEKRILKPTSERGVPEIKYTESLKRVTLLSCYN